MNRRRLGKSDLHITPLGVGTWVMGGPIKNWGRGPQTDQDLLAAMERALDMGMNWIDTAPVYGVGHAEELVGTLLKRRAGATRPLIFTKCGIRWDKDENYMFSLKEASLRRELEESLRRLGVEAIDLYQIHTPSYPRRSPYKGGIEEAISAMSRFRAEGKIREIGISNFDVPQIQTALSIAGISCLQPQYSLLQREVEQQVLPFCAQKEIGVIVYSPMHSGLLSGSMSREDREPACRRLAEAPARFSRAEAVGKSRSGRTGEAARGAIWLHGRGDRGCLDPARQFGHRCHCRRTKAGPGGCGVRCCKPHPE